MCCGRSYRTPYSPTLAIATGGGPNKRRLHPDHTKPQTSRSRYCRFVGWRLVLPRMHELSIGLSRQGGTNLLHVRSHFPWDFPRRDAHPYPFESTAFINPRGCCTSGGFACPWLMAVSLAPLSGSCSIVRSCGIGCSSGCLWVMQPCTATLLPSILRAYELSLVGVRYCSGEKRRLENLAP